MFCDLCQAAAQSVFNSAEVALARGDFVVARELADTAVAVATGWQLVAALLVRARVVIAEGELAEGERDAHEALACAANSRVYLPVPGILECLAGLAITDGNHHEAARLLGAADARFDDAWAWCASRFTTPRTRLR